MSEVQNEVQAEGQEASPQFMVQLLKLTSGEELITEIVVQQIKDGQQIIHLVNPCSVEREFAAGQCSDRVGGRVGQRDGHRSHQHRREQARPGDHQESRWGVHARSGGSELFH